MSTTRLLAILGFAVTATSAAQADTVTLIDGASLSWATTCQQQMSVINPGQGQDPYLGNCPITLAEPVREWNFYRRHEAISYTDRLTARDMPEWVASWQERVLSSMADHLTTSGFSDSETVNAPLSLDVAREQAALAAVQARIEENASRPAMQREALGLMIVADEPWIQVEYEGEMENPNPHYTGSNPFRQMGSSMNMYGNGALEFQGVANIEAGQSFYIFSAEGELLDVREINSATTTSEVFMSINDPKGFSPTASYRQQFEINRNGRATEPHPEIEDTRYEAFKAAFAELGEKLAEAAPATFEDVDRIKAAAGL